MRGKKVALEIVKSRDAKTLTEFTRRHVALGTEVWTDLWAG